ncbi:MAG: tetratricopeptide repeat protein [Caulobacteraceae bacterium]
MARAKDFTILGYTFHNADFVVASPQLAPLDGLIGNNLLSFADTEFDLANGVIRLFKPVGCSQNTNLAYWAAQTGVYGSVPMPAASAPDFKIVVHVQVNGHDMTAIVDSGAGRSYISRDAAKTAGVTVNAAGVRTAGVGYGIGRHPINSWTATFQTFRIGDEEVKNAVLEIGDGQLSDADMLIGADFLLSHRVYVANSEHKLFFSYLGGPVFNLDQAPTAKTTGAAAAAVAGAPADSPADASSLNRRGAAFAARHDYVDAIADFTRAATLEPANARPLYDRGMAHWRNDEPAAARADFDAAIKLDPRDAGRPAGARRTAAGRQGRRRRGRRLRRRAADRTGRPAGHRRLLRRGRALRAGGGGLRPVDRRQSEGPTGRQRVQWPLLDEGGVGQGPRCGPGRLQRRGSSGGRQSAFLDTRGYAFLRLGQPEKAVSDYDAALRIDPKQASSLYGRGVAELRLGRKSQATPTSPRLPPLRRDCRRGRRRRASRRSARARTAVAAVELDGKQARTLTRSKTTPRPPGGRYTASVTLLVVLNRNCHRKAPAGLRGALNGIPYRGARVAGELGVNTSLPFMGRDSRCEAPAGWGCRTPRNGVADVPRTPPPLTALRSFPPP